MLEPVSTISQVRRLLSRVLNKETFVFLFFLCLSGVFWLTMTLNETYEREVKIPLQLVGVPSNVVITTPLTDTLKVTLKDKGFVLASYTMGQKLHPVVVYFNTYANKQTGHGVVPVSEVQKMVKQQLAGSTSITQIKSDQLEFYFNYGLKKHVRVQLVGNIVPAKNYYLSRTEFYPEMVSVYASKDRLDSIKSVQTEFVNIVNFDDTVTVKVKLRAMKGVKLTPTEVQLRLFPDILTEESLEVPIRTVNKPENLILRTFPQRVKVSFTVGASMFRYIKPTDFMVVVDYAEVANHPSDKCNLYLRAKPQGVSNVRLEMTQVDYLMEQQ